MSLNTVVIISINVFLRKNSKGNFLAAHLSSRISLVQFENVHISSVTITIDICVVERGRASCIEGDPQRHYFLFC